MTDDNGKKIERYEEIIRNQAETIQILSRLIDERSEQTNNRAVVNENRQSYAILWSLVESIFSSTIAAFLIAFLSSGNVFAVIIGFSTVMLLAFITLYPDIQIVKEASRRVEEAENQRRTKRKNNDTNPDIQIQQMLDRLAETSPDESKEDINRIRDILRDLQAPEQDNDSQ